MKKRLRIIIPLVLAIAALVYWRLKTNAFTYAGTVEATEVNISAKVSSALKTINVKEGQKVQEGDLLASMTGEDLRLAQSQAGEDYYRGALLFKSGSLPQETFDQLRSQKAMADLKVEWCNIKSPLTGTVLTQYHQPGEWVGTGTRLFTLADLREVWCLLYVPQPMLAKLSLGQKLAATLPEMPEKTFEGTITHISDEAEFTPKNVQTRQERVRLIYSVKVVFQNPNGLLKPGMSLEMDLPE